MASDRDRLSYDAKQQYRSVVAQQGRVMVPADFNEMQEIAAEELREEALDFVGPCGTPDNGYQITIPDSSTVPLDFLINPGTMYVGGIRAYLPPSKDLKEKRILYSKQPDRLNPTPQMPVGLGGSFLEFIWLELWEQEISAAEDPNLKDVALGGPDTTQRTRIIQAVTRYITTADTCDKALAAQADLWKAGGQDFDPTTMRLNSQASLKVGFENVVSDPNPCDPVAQGGYLGAENQLIRVRISELGEIKKSGKFVWGFDNSSFVYRVTLGSDGKTLKLDVPPIDVFHFPKKNQAVEVLGTQAVLSDGEFVATDTGTVFLLADDYNPDTLSVSLPSIYKPAPNTPQLFLRVWQEQIAFEAGKPKSLGQTGVQVTLRTNADTFHLSDYWAFAVRPNTPARVYPKRYVDDYQAPEGPRKWVCPLAVIKWTGNIQTKGEVLADCTNFFPALTALTSFFYLGGDGQEAHLDGTLSYPLEAGVANGKYPVNNARVRFKITSGGGTLSGVDSNSEVRTGTGGVDGVARCKWVLGNPSQDQVVTAELLGSDGKRRHLPIDFSASYMRARDVIYDPGSCKTTQKAKDVQDAIDTLCHLVSLYYVGGSGQQITPGVSLQLQALAANRCGPVSGQAVTFKVISGKGTLAPAMPVITGNAGVATCTWTPDNETPFQEVEATLTGDPSQIAAPSTVRFSATLKPSASCCTVMVTPQDLTGETTLQTIVDRLRDVLKLSSAKICLQPGTYVLPNSLELGPEHSRLTIEGCHGPVEIRGDGKGNFLHGLVALNRAQEITLRGLQFILPQVDFDKAGGLLADIPQDVLINQIVGPNIAQLKTAVGIQLVESADLRVEDCSFAFQSIETFIFEAGILGTGNCGELVLKNNRFIHLPGQSFPGKTLEGRFGCLLAPSISRLQFTTANAFSVNAQVLPTRVSQGLISENIFVGLSAAALIQADIAENLRIESNTVERCYSGFNIFALRFQRFNEPPFVNTLIDLPFAMGRSFGTGFPLPAEFDGQGLIPVLKANGSALSILPNDSGLAQAARLENVFATAEASAFGAEQDPLVLSLFRRVVLVNGNHINTVITGRSETDQIISGSAFVMWGDAKDTKTQLVLNGNSMRSQPSLVPLGKGRPTPVAAVFAVSWGTVTGNLILNEATRENQISLAVVGLSTSSTVGQPGGATGTFTAGPAPSGAQVPVTQGGFITVTIETINVAVTGNTMRGNPLLPSRNLKPPFDQWDPLNLIIPT
jgi:hypothetical protein